VTRVDVFNAVLKAARVDVFNASLNAARVDVFNALLKALVFNASFIRNKVKN
jgi:hypothetical protein